MILDRRSAVRTLMASGAGSFMSAWAQIAHPEEESKDYTLRSSAVLVLLDVSVKDREGRFVTGLLKSNFTVLEEGKAQAIAVFDSGDRPVDLGILVDESRSMTPKRRDVVTAAQTLIDESNPRDEVFVLHFNDRVTLGLPRGVLFSGDPQKLREALARVIPAGKTALNDAMIEGLDHLKLGQRDKKTLVLISDGGDNASRHTRLEAIETIESGIATIYAIGLYDPEDPDSNPNFLRRLANSSGGEAYFPASSGELVPICRRIAKEIRMRYTVGFVPRATGGNSSRHIQVLVSAPSHGRVNVRARSRYRYD